MSHYGKYDELTRPDQDDDGIPVLFDEEDDEEAPPPNAVVDEVAEMHVQPSTEKAQVNAADEMKALRMKNKNTLFAALAISCKDYVHNSVMIVLTMIRPARSDHAENTRVRST